MTTYWWGSYPHDGLGSPTGTGEGLWRQHGDDAQLVLELPAPSFVVAHPDLPLLYAVSESDATQVHAISIADSGEPELIGSLTTGGKHGCHLLLSRDCLTLYVVHYTSGDLAVIALTSAGQFADGAPRQTFGHDGSGPREDRQEAPHAHYVGYAPGDSHLLVVDLGTDELRAHTIEHDGGLGGTGIATALPPGAGPRHFAARGDLLYLVCELDHTLRTLRWDRANATAEVIHEQPTTLAPHRTGDAIYDAHVDIVGDVLLVSVRGCDVISVFDLGPEGHATYRAAFDAGYWPRHFAVVGETIVVGNERGHEVRVFDLADVLALAPENEAGAIAQLESRVAVVRSPACIVATA
jgi:6-phosphogluconolactonase